MRLIVFSIFVAFVFYHLAVGLPAILSLSLTRKIARKLYRLDLPENMDPRYEYALKALGFYALTIAAISVGPLLHPDPAVEAFLLAALAGLLILRALGRFFYRDLLYRAFAITWRRSRWNVFFNLIVAGLMIALALQIQA